MPKPNTYIQLRQAQQEIVRLKFEVERMKGSTLQQSLDMAVITLHTEFGFGPDRCMKFKKAFHEKFLWYAKLCVEDAQDDEAIDYTKAKVDEVLEEAYGEPQDFDQRYAAENLYFRDRDLKENNHDNESQ